MPYYRYSFTLTGRITIEASNPEQAKREIESELENIAPYSADLHISSIDLNLDGEEDEDYIPI